MGETMKKFKFKDDLSPTDRCYWVLKLLNLTLLTDEQVKYSHTYRVLKMLGLPQEVCERKMQEDYGCPNRDLIKHAIQLTNSLESSVFETNSPFVDIYCTYHIDEMLDAKDDLLLYQTKKGDRKYITLKELHYYYFRLNKQVFSAGGYDMTTARNYFLSPGFKNEYKKQTNRTISSHKIALFHRILNKYDLIRVYQVKKKPNLYVLGKKNPCYWFQGVLENEDMAVVNKLIKDNKYHVVNLTPKDLKIKKLEEKNEEAKEEIKALNKEIENLKYQSRYADSLSEDIRFYAQRENELLEEISQLKEQQISLGEWNIGFKPTNKFDFEEKFREKLDPDSIEKHESVDDATEDLEEEIDYMESIREITRCFGNQEYSHCDN
jgi:hypothetical protein